MADGDLLIRLGYETTGNLQNWDRPGWYLYAAAENTHVFAVEPVRLRPETVVEIAKAIDTLTVNEMRGRLQPHVVKMNGDAAERLRDRVARLEGIERELATARDDLARYEAGDA